MREYLNDDYKRVYDRTYQALIKAGCDTGQARAIAKERVIKLAMDSSLARARSHAFED